MRNSAVKHIVLIGILILANACVTENIRYYNVSFESNGGSAIPIQKVEVRGTPTKPEDPARDNFKFLNWYSDTELTILFNFKTGIIKPTKAYADWEELPYEVIFDVNGGNESIETKKVEKGMTIEEPEYPIRTGYAFMGWYVYDELATVDEEYIFSTPVTGKLELYARWNKASNYRVEGSKIVKIFREQEILRIPKNINGIDITSISGEQGLGDIVYNVFGEYIGESKIIKKIIFHENIRTIGDYAFRNCVTIEEVEMPKKVSNIGKRSFENCRGLKTVEIPDNVLLLSNEAFKGCTGLLDISLPESLISIGNGTFQGCEKLEKITIPNSVTSIRTDTFSGCTALKDIVMEKISSIGHRAFKDCTSLEQIIFPPKVRTIGNEVFFGASSLILLRVEVSQTVPSLGFRCFEQTPANLEIKVPKLVLSLYKKAQNWSANASQISDY